jgi:hypothetical protein
MALTPAQVRQISAEWAQIVYERSGGTVIYALDQISDGVSQIDAGVTVNGAVISGTMNVTGAMRFMTTRETSIMLALVLQTRTGI